MKTLTRHAWGPAILLLVGFMAGLACDRAANQPASAEIAKNLDPATANEEPSSPPDVKVKRVGSVIGLKKEKRDYYNELHANPWPEINAMLKKCNVRNYSIYECELDGKLYLFSYFEYVGDNFEKDMATLAADPKTQEWWTETDPCQIRLPGTPEGQQWKTIEEVYRLD